MSRSFGVRAGALLCLGMASVLAMGRGPGVAGPVALDGDGPNPVPTAAPGRPLDAAPASASPLRIYVGTDGSDDNPGSREAPYRTIAQASRKARPGTTIFVAPGTYEGGFRTMTSGTETGRIAYVSTARWGAKIVPPARSRSRAAWENRGSYVDIVGFEVDGSEPRDGTGWTLGIYNTGSFDSIRDNHVHHIATTVPCTSGGGSAIGVDSYYHGVQGDVIGNVVHDIGPDGCRFVQGIYVSTSGTVKNNVVYRVSGAAIHLWHDARDVIIANNTVAASETGIVVGGGDFYHASGPCDNTIVANNIVYDNKYGISEHGKTGTHNAYRNNLVARNSAYDFRLRNGLTPVATVDADPKFAAYARAGTPDFHLGPDSPAIGRGTADDAPTLDIEGKPRSQATGFDLGAYQHGAAPGDDGKDRRSGGSDD